MFDLVLYNSIKDNPCNITREEHTPQHALIQGYTGLNMHSPMHAIAKAAGTQKHNKIGRAVGGMLA
jgi:hypothetical protein